jgi:hypothetical protein
VCVTATVRVDEIRDAFIALEEQCGLWDLVAYGQPYWHQIRHAVYLRVLQALDPSSRAQQSWRHRPVSSWLSAIRPGYLAPALRRSIWDGLEPADVLVINHPRHVLQAGQWVCPYTAPLLNDLGRSYWVIEDQWQGVHSHPQTGWRVKYLELGFLFAQLGFLVRHGLAGGRLSAAEREAVRGWSDELRTRLGGGPSHDRALAIARAGVRELAAFAGLYGRLLDRVAPKLVVVVVHYSYRCLPLTAAARRRGIVVAELQHGTLGRNHIAYNVAAGRSPPAFPDYLLTFGDWWRDITPGLPLSREAAPAIGYAWLEDYQRTSPERPRRERRTVLFISQGTVGVELSRLAAEVSRRTDARVRYRLHPGEILGWPQRYPWLRDAPVEIIEAPTNIYDDFVGADVLVGVYSTAVFEGIAFGLPLVVARLPGHETVLPLIEAGGGVLVDGPDELTRAILSAEPPPPRVREMLWKPDAAQNFRAFVDQVIA